MKSKNGREIIDIDLLKKYFSGTTDAREEEIVRRWFTDPAVEEVLRYRLQEHWNDFDTSEEKDPDKELMLEHIYRRIYKDHWEHYYKEKRSFVGRAYNVFLRVAAVLIIPLTLFTLWYILGDSNEGKNEIVEIHSPLGARVYFTLPDGSTGWLNSGSVLKYPARFSRKERNVSLSGEGYFDVIKNPQRPFVVNADDILVTALGTRFDVMTYPKDQTVDVVLVSGKIVIYKSSRDKPSKKKAITTLEKGTLVSVTKDGKILSQGPVLTEKFVAWKDGTLVFRNDPMAEVIKKINRWYNVQMVIKDPEILEYRYRATFNDETLDEVLKMLKITSPIDYYAPKRKVHENGEIDKKVIYLFLKENKKKYISAKK